jgi:orotate phosphoribosyltransferase
MVNEIAALLKKSGAVTLGDFLLASGARSRYYIDVKTAITEPGLLRRIGEEIAKRIDCEVVAGMAIGGIPLAVAASFASNLPYVIVRNEEKEHGKGGWIIGAVKGKYAVLVEDVTTSGGSALRGVRALQREGAQVDTVITVVDREEGARERLEKEGLRFLALVTASELTAE